jgi:hypothetical protein
MNFATLRLIVFAFKFVLTIVASELTTDIWTPHVVWSSILPQHS